MGQPSRDQRALPNQFLQGHCGTRTWLRRATLCTAEILACSCAYNASIASPTEASQASHRFCASVCHLSAASVDRCGSSA